LQKQFGLRLTERKREDALAALLPKSLRILYEKIQAYNDIAGTFSFSHSSFGRIVINAKNRLKK
jgi:hypothetical protein